MGKTKYLSAFERGMVVGVRCTGLCQELQCCWVFHAQQFHVCIKNVCQGIIPRGHRWQIEPSLVQRWCAILNTCSIDLMTLIVDQLKRDFIEMDNNSSETHSSARSC
jgi:hypothetical protein